MKIDKQISHYTIISPLGSGGMGIVYKARDNRLKRTVALKFLPPELTRDRDAKKRFINEARAASNLDHVNICTIYEVDETTDENCFIAMSYCEGVPLNEIIKQGPLEFSKITDISTQIARGLSCAHKSKVIHRDIKPANIMVDRAGKVKIVDFGLAKLIGQTKITRDSITMGTVAYMSPEQAEGRSVDHRCDIWSLGIVIYEMLTGETPFKGDYAQAVLYSIINDQPESVSRMRQGVPGKLESLVNKCLAKNKCERYQSVNEILAELDQFRSEDTSNYIQKKSPDRAEKLERGLAAIMFTDMVGYSRLAQENEELSLNLLEEHRQILRTCFKNFKGKEIETIGDAFFVEFGSSTESVKCAIDIQKQLRERNTAVPNQKKIQVRIGIHVGDVIHDGKQVVGDGVNIAARLEPLAEPGGICISEDVARQVHNKIKLPLKKLRHSKLKNIQLPIQIFKVILPWDLKNLAYTQRLYLGLKRSKTSRLLVFTSFLAIAILVVYLTVFFPDYANNIAGEPENLFIHNRIAVLPFTSMSNDPENEYFSDGLTEELITALARIKGLRVIARTSVMQYKNTLKSITEIARDLNIAMVIEGSVRVQSDRVRITVQLINARNEEHLWAQNYDRKLRDIFTIQDDISSKVAQKMKIILNSEEKERLSRKPTKNIDAYNLYLKGRYFWNKRMPQDIIKALTYFKQATEKDTNFALAYSGMADSYHFMASYGLLPPKDAFTQAKVAAQEALRINPNLPEAHASMAAIHLLFDWDWNNSEKEFISAIALDSNNVTTHLWYALLCCVNGKTDLAIQKINKALEIDPVSAIAQTDLGQIQYFNRQYEQAIGSFNKSLQLDSTYVYTYAYLGLVYIKTGRIKEAINSFQKAVTITQHQDPATLAGLACAYAVSGEEEKTRILLSNLDTLAQYCYIHPFYYAGIYVGLGEYQTALSWLEKGYRERSEWMVYLNIEHLMEPIQNKPRFKQLVRKIGL
jgi:serine/threonine protein kinase/TolB-like protein/Flp pilus assembly protein TadD